MKLWGVEANEKDIAVSLPGGLRGLVRANEASGLIAGFGTGTGRKKVWLSLRLAVLHKNLTWDAIQEGMVLMVYVKSIEDRGYILNFGPYSFTGFLSRKNIIDPSTRAVGLTMNYHLVHNEAPPSLELIECLTCCLRFLQLQYQLLRMLAYRMWLMVEIRKLEKKYKEGNTVRACILGFRHLEGPALGIFPLMYFLCMRGAHHQIRGLNLHKKFIENLSTKAGALRDQFSLTQMPSQAWWGEGNLCQELWCSCAAIDWCEGPLSSYTELEVPKPGKKFKVGVDLTFRVLGFKSRLISLTHKETRVKSKLAILSSYADATDGLITHGWIRSEKSKHMGAL
ncbi:rRNA biogenesis protein RRP5-like isoform X2 [Papaver somniferum]|uniref:rRNA biogenesis protein RRP5-like isoform X2 n=1 Tax=Papaver somniferum TaxID=3469 RepID=UPI000E6F89AD|nr:rRNA biogenesis protein RRP5-like isoform X2 [Papaver somniferum]